MFWTIFFQAVAVLAVVLVIAYLIQKFVIRLPEGNGG